MSRSCTPPPLPLLALLPSRAIYRVMSERAPVCGGTSAVVEVGQAAVASGSEAPALSIEGKRGTVSVF